MSLDQLREGLVLAILLLNFFVLGTSRLSSGIRSTALQGAALAMLPVALHPAWSPHVILIAVGTFTIKSLLIPSLLLRAIREAAIRREVEPHVGFVGSLLLGALAVLGAFAVTRRLPVRSSLDELLVAAALATVTIGLLVIATRRKALNQVIGYVLLENGVYLYGLTQSDRVPFLVEMGVLLDVFVGVFVMGIVLFHINREFDSLDSERLADLRER
jgi:hydrogenase-4 component E